MDSDGLRKEKLIEKWKQRRLNFWLILEGSNKGVKKIGVQYTPYATPPEFLKISMGIIFYSLYHATVTFLQSNKIRCFQYILYLHMEVFW